MRVISLVPSWTETLLAAGCEVVGRTRFCVHPVVAASAIPVVGGTKDIDWRKVTELKPDLVVLDREENPKAFADESPVPTLVTHVTGINDMPRELRALAARLELAKLEELAGRWEIVAGKAMPAADLQDLPGVLELWRPPGPRCDSMMYMIWKNPWMAAGHSTFIGSMLEHFGYADLLMPRTGEKYPEIDLGFLDRERTLVLFSSEPYPFRPQRRELERLGFACALIDGEAYSWFGVRSLEFLERQHRSV